MVFIIGGEHQGKLDYALNITKLKFLKLYYFERRKDYE